MNIAGSGFNVGITRTGFFEFQIAASGATVNRPRELFSSDVPRAGVEAHLAGEPREAKVARTALQFNLAALQALNRLIARASPAAERGLGRNRDLIVHGDVANVSICN